MINAFKIGADPEFIMADSSNTLHFWPGHEDEIRTNAGTAGPDHGGLVAELRPKPAIGTYTLVKRIGEMLANNAWDKHRNFRWLAGPVQTVVVPNCDHHCDACCDENACDGNAGDLEELNQPLGGHIHLDIRANDPRWDSVVEALDEQHRLFENLDLYPKDQCETRRNEGYGKFAWVTCNSAGNANNGNRYEKEDLDNYAANGIKNPADYHMEFRTPPSWLNHPRLSMLALTSAKLAAADPQGTIDALKEKPIHLNTLKNWYERYRGKDANADRVIDRILFRAQIKHLQFDTQKDLKDVWATLDF